MTTFKKIKDYEPVELNAAVDEAVDYLDKRGIDFWMVLKGIDAYMERRARKERAKPAGTNTHYHT